MPNQHKTPLLGWHPLAELSARARAEAERRGVALRVILDEALAGYFARLDEASGECPHPERRINKGLCGACGTNVGTKAGGQ